MSYAQVTTPAVIIRDAAAEMSRCGAASAAFVTSFPIPAFFHLPSLGETKFSSSNLSFISGDSARTGIGYLKCLLRRRPTTAFPAISGGGVVELVKRMRRRRRRRRRQRRRRRRRRRRHN